MPNVYKEKICLKCKKKHKKRGPFCSQSCSSKDRPASENVKNALRQTAIEYNQTPAGVAQQKLINTGLVSDDFAIEIPSLGPDLSDYNDYNKAEDW